MMQLASGRAIPLGEDGRPAYTPGMLALGAALIALPRHRFDKDKRGYLVDLLTRFDCVPDEILAAVAAEIDDMAERGLRQQPRYPVLARMVVAAWTMDRALGELARRRKGCLTAKRVLPHRHGREQRKAAHAAKQQQNKRPQPHVRVL